MSTNLTTGLEAFLTRALVPARRERYLGLVASPRGTKKFLASLSHDFVRALDRTYVVERVDDDALDQLGELYRSDGTTSTGAMSMRQLYDEAPWEGGWLLIGATGTIGVHRPEGWIDDEVWMRVPTTVGAGIS